MGSNAIYPGTVFPGFAFPVVRTPETSTIVQRASSGKTGRLGLWPTPLWHYELDYEVLFDRLRGSDLETNLRTIMGFYEQRLGPYESFLLDDADDDEALGQQIGVGDGATELFQAGRSLGGFFEPIQDPIINNVYVNGARVNPGPSALPGPMWYCGVENLLLQSRDMSQASVWNITNATVVPNVSFAPDGTNTANQIEFPGTVESFVAQGFLSGTSFNVPLAGVQFTASVWLRIPFGSGSISLSLFNQLGRVVGSLTCSLNSDWQRFTVTATASQFDTTLSFAVIVASGPAVNFQAWGPQLERWPNPSSYNVTTTQQVKPNGLVALTTAPAAGAVVAIDADFRWRVRFDGDKLDFEKFMAQLWTLRQVKLEQVRL
jgi:hypothetical protein